MTSYLLLGLAAAIIVAIAWLLIKAGLNTARQAGAAEQRAGDQADARAAEAEMAEVQGEVITEPELRKRIKDGTFGGQEP